MYAEQLAEEFRMQEILRERELKKKMGIVDEVPKKKKEKEIGSFMVTEAPHDHPDNVTGNLKILME